MWIIDTGCRYLEKVEETIKESYLVSIDQAIYRWSYTVLLFVRMNGQTKKSITTKMKVVRTKLLNLIVCFSFYEIDVCDISM